MPLESIEAMEKILISKTTFRILDLNLFGNLWRNPDIKGFCKLYQNVKYHQNVMTRIVGFQKSLLCFQESTPSISPKKRTNEELQFASQFPDMILQINSPNSHDITN